MITYPTNKLQKVLLAGKCRQGVLPVGYTQLEYLEIATEGVYFATGIMADIDTEMEITASNIMSTSSQLMVAQCKSGMDYFRIAKANASQMVIGTLGSETITDNNSDGVAKFTAKVNKTGFYVNGTLIGSFTNAPSTLTDIGEIEIFRGKYSNSTYFAYQGTRFYGARINSSFVVVPCRRDSDNALGIFNKVNGTFILPNVVDNGSFIAGPDIVYTTPTCEYGEPVTVSAKPTEVVRTQATDYAPVKSMKGNTVKWNQLVENGDFSNGTTGWRKHGNNPTSVINKILSITNSTSTDYTMQHPISYIVGHKYILSVVARVSNGTQSAITYFGGSSNSVTISFTNTSFKKKSGLFTCQTNQYNEIRLGFGGTIGAVFYISSVECFDLTAMGIADQINSVSDFNTWLSTNVGLKDYYPYDAGSLLSVNTPSTVINDKEYPFPITTLTDINGTVMFPNGLCQAGSIKDEIDFEHGTAVKRVGVVDLGVYSNDFDLVNGNDTIRYYLNRNLDLSIPITTFNPNVKNNVICSKYDIEAFSIIWGRETSNCIAVFYSPTYNSPAIVLSRDVNINNLSGVMLYYELATPVEYTLSVKGAIPTPDAPTGIWCNNGVVKVHNKSGLPLGYQMVESITFDSNSYIDTGIKANSAYTYKFKVKRTAPYNHNIWGAKTNTSYTANSCIILGWTGSNNLGIYSHDGADTGSNPAVVSWGANYHTIEFNPISKKLIIDDVDRWDDLKCGCLTNESWSSNIYNLYLGGTNTVGSFVGGGVSTWAEYEVWNGSTLVQRLIPCKTLAGVAGFYDTVTNTFLTNAGTGDFTAGAVDDEVEIYTDGTQEVVTDNLGNTANAEMLLDVGDYKDTQSVLDGKVTRNVAIKVLNGTEAWGRESQYSRFYLNFTPVSIVKSSARSIPAYCTHFEMLSNGVSIADVTIGQGYITRGAQSQIYSTVCFHSEITTIEAFKQYLADQYANGTPVIIVYPLAESTTEQVTPQPLAGSSVTVTAGSIDNLPIESSTTAGLKKRYIGDKEVKRVYIGENLVWESN